MACHFTKILLECNFTQTVSLEENKIKLNIRLRMKGCIIFLFSLYFTSFSLFVFLCCSHTDSWFVSPLFFYYLVFNRNVIEDTVTFSQKANLKPCHIILSAVKICFSCKNMQKHAEKNPNMLVDLPSFFHFLTRED